MSESGKYSEVGVFDIGEDLFHQRQLLPVQLALVGRDIGIKVRIVRHKAPDRPRVPDAVEERRVDRLLDQGHSARLQYSEALTEGLLHIDMVQDVYSRNDVEVLVREVEFFRDTHLQVRSVWEAVTGDVLLRKCDRFAADVEALDGVPDVPAIAGLNPLAATEV